MAPKADNVAVLPTQIAVVLKAAVTVGFGLTTKFKVVVAIHAKAVVPDNEYVVVVAGATPIGFPVKPPGNQV